MAQKWLKTGKGGKSNSKHATTSKKFKPPFKKTVKDPKKWQKMAKIANLTPFFELFPLII